MLASLIIELLSLTPSIIKDIEDTAAKMKTDKTTMNKVEDAAAGAERLASMFANLKGPSGGA